MRHLILLLGGCLMAPLVSAQLLLNEASNMNQSGLIDEDGDHEDWVELFNAGNTAVDLGGYRLSDQPSQPDQWIFPSVVLAPQAHLLVFASGKDRRVSVDHWEQVVGDASVWDYTVPNAQPAANWNTLAYQPVGWGTGPSGFGYGDNDDATVLPVGTVSVYLRHVFQVAQLADIAAAILHMDYDDGFVAYLNGHEIARAGLTGQPPAYQAGADADHEALMYQGLGPDRFVVPQALLAMALQPGDNVLAIQIHNRNAQSSDLTARPFLHLGIRSADQYFGAPALWFAGEATVLHTHFTLRTTGETVVLSDPQGNLLDSMTVDAQELNFSVGRATDGGPQRAVFPTPTPGATNNGAPSYDGFLPEPVVLPSSGRYNGSVTVTVQPVPAGQKIYYTLNGATPTVNSPLYTGPVVLAQSAVFRARVFSVQNNLLPGRTANRTYWVNEQFPVPVLSIVTDSTNLYGPTGIFDNYNQDWDRPCFAEMFDSAGVPMFQTLSNIRMDGGAGRWKPQKPFRLEPDHKYFGEGDVDAVLLPDKPTRSDFASMYIRNGGLWWMRQTYKEAMMARMMKNLNVEYSAYRPIAVFVNGAFYGIAELREKQDERAFAANRGSDPDHTDLLGVSLLYGGGLRVMEGDDDDFLALHAQIIQADPLDGGFYALVDQQLDLHNFADYSIAEHWAANTDWPHNNLKIWRSRAPHDRWRFVVMDLEAGIGAFGWVNQQYNMFTYLDGVGAQHHYASMYRQIIRNPTFQKYFINRFADLMNTEFLPSRIQWLCQKVYDEFVPLLPRNYNRWGAIAGFYNGLADYQNQFAQYQNTTVSQATARNAVVRNQIQAYFGLAGQVDLTLDVHPAGAGVVRINTIQPGPYPWEGVYFNGVPVTVTAVPYPGQAFSHWEASPFIADTTAPSFTANASVDAVFRAHFVPAQAPQIVVHEIQYHPDPTRDDGEWIELHNHGIEPIPLDGWYFTDSDPLHRYDFPAGTVLPAGGYLPVVADTAHFAAEHPGVPFVGPFDFGLSNSGDAVQLYAPPGVLYRHLAYQDSLPWPTGADGGGRTLELLAVNGLQDSPGNWFDGCVGGSPGEAYSACLDSLLISEINYRSDPLVDAGDWIELRNRSQQALDLSGWVFKDADDAHAFVLPAGTILAPSAHLVLYETAAAFQQVHPGMANVLGPLGFGLSASGERLRLYDASGKLRFSLDYRSDGSWPTTPNGGGFTLELLDPDGRMNSGDNWFAGCPQGSPGQFYVFPCPPDSAITGTVREPVPTPLYLFPNPATGHVQAVFSATYDMETVLTVYDALGRVWRRTPIAVVAGENRLFLPLTDLESGLYRLELPPLGSATLVKY